MCGIAGIVVAPSRTPSQNLIDSAIRTLAHRGPDGSGYHVVKNVALIHTRLSIIDLEGGAQPLLNKEASLSLVANGEIYNYVELLDPFIAQGQTLSSRSDSEAIIQGYADTGVDSIVNLHGMYAFALFDENNDRLLLVRDRLGIKPLYFAQSEGNIFFASEIKTLLALLPKQPKIRRSAVAGFLQNQFCTGRETIFEGVFRVLPGEYVAVCTKTLTLDFHRYWNAAEVQSRQCDMPTAQIEFEQLFEQVMVEHMRSDVPFGLFLSGGIDSSLILAALHQWQGEKIRTYSVGYQDVAMKDELNAAEALAAHFKTDHVSLKVSRDDLFERIVHTVWSTDDLMRDFASLPTSLLSERAARDVKVVFSGEGGDEAFAGYRRYASTFENHLKGIVRGTGGFRTRGQWDGRLPRRALGKELSACDARAPFKAIWQRAPAQWSNMQRRQLVDIQTALPDNLFVKGDRIMMSFGLEGRVPFADHRVIEFGLSLPDQLKMQGTTGKQLLRQWGLKMLPAELLNRPKSGFYVPVNEWLSGDFLNQLEQQLLANRLIHYWFNIDGVKNLFTAQRSGKNYARHIWCLMQFAIWHKLFVDKTGVVPAPRENPLDWI